MFQVCECVLYPFVKNTHSHGLSDYNVLTWYLALVVYIPEP